MRHLLGRFRITVLSAAVALAGAGVFAEPGDTKDGAAKSNGSTAKSGEAKPKPRKVGQTEALTKAIAELSKEFKDFQDKPDSNSLRTSSDYFKGALPEDTTIEDILAVLNQSMSGPPAQVAYIKWQLLSAAPAKFEDSQVRQARAALSRAPQPLPPVATSPHVRQQLDRLVQGKKVSEVESDIIDQFKKEQDKVDALNAPIAGYRMALWQRLPTSFETLLLGFEEIVVRMNAGINSNELNSRTKSLAGEIRAWATIDAKPDEINNMLGTVRKLKSYKATVSAYSPALNSSDGSKPAKWALYPTGFGKLLDELETVLKDAAANAASGGGGGLKFKDDKKK
jgi:hypothetical protein